MAPRKQNKYQPTGIPVESSWRMIDGGENDSFDTSIINDPYEDEFVISSGPSQLSASSQGPSFGSQDSIRDFANNADEERVILRSPFHPSLASTRHTSLDDEDRTPVPELIMPTVDVGASGQSTRSSGTIRPPGYSLRRRNFPTGDRSPPLGYDNNRTRRGYGPHESPSREYSMVENMFPNWVSRLFIGTAGWFLSLGSMVLEYAKRPIAFALVVWLFIGALMAGKNMVLRSISTSLSPICQIPGITYLDLSFCTGLSSAGNWSQPVEFDQLMTVQDKFENVLDDTAEGVSLPFQMKKTETAIRDLRTLVRYSDLKARNELLAEFELYLDIVHVASNDMQKFNTHVGTAVDRVIAINRWTSRYLDSILIEREESNSLVARISDWVFTPFQLPQFDERKVIDTYIAHTTFVADRIEELVLEAKGLLNNLAAAEGHLKVINDLAVRDSVALQKEKQANEGFWNVWTILGANKELIHSLKNQLDLLSKVNAQRLFAVRQLSVVVHDLTDIQTNLEDLRERVKMPHLVTTLESDVPLQVHIDTIDSGVARLEAARSRIKAKEADKIRNFKEWAKGDARQIEG